MKTGLTKKQKTTSAFFTDADERIEVCTHNTALKNRLAAFAEKYPAECRLIDDDENGCQTYEISKGRFSFKLTPPYSKERKQAATIWQRKISKISIVVALQNAKTWRILPMRNAPAQTIK